MEQEKTGEIKLPDVDSSFFVQEAESLRLQGKHDEAIQTCKDGLKKMPDALPGRLLLGRCYLETGRIVEARKELEKVAQVIEECLPVYKLLSQVYLEEKDVDKALEVLRKTLYFPRAEEGPPKKVTPLEMDLLHRGIRPAFATPPSFQKPSPPSPVEVPEEKKAEEEEKPAKPIMQTDTLAEIYIKQGHPEQALEVYQDILAKDPQNKAAKEKYEALKRTMGKDPKEEPRRKVEAELEKWLGVLSSKT